MQACSSRDSRCIGVGTVPRWQFCAKRKLLAAPPVAKIGLHRLFGIRPDSRDLVDEGPEE